MSTVLNPPSPLRKWVRAHPTVKSLLRLPSRLASPFRRGTFFNTVLRYPEFLSDLAEFRRMGGMAPTLRLYPFLHERTASHGVDPHYFYQAFWAARKIFAQHPDVHYDVGSQANYVGMVAAAIPVRFVDLRPFGVDMPELQDDRGTVLDLPYETGSIRSLSCLHVIEHIGLGRYGDPIDPDGPAKAAAELTRVLGQGGNLYVSVPVGRSAVEFNAHRVLDAVEFARSFAPLSLVEFSMVDDDGRFRVDVPMSAASDQNFACGFFHFRRES